MIERITGKLVFRDGNHIVIDVNGVAYGVDTTMGVADHLQIDAQAVLWIYTHVREDEIKLFGFATIEEKILFTHLLSAPGVGAKLAMAMLSILGASGIVNCVLSDDSEQLKEVPGISAKAKEIQLHLKRRLTKLEDDAWLIRLKTLNNSKRVQPLEFENNLAKGATKNLSPQLLANLQSALVNLGYREREVQNTIKSLSVDEQTKTFEALLRRAISILSSPEKRSPITANNSEKRQTLIDEVF